jgi:hypothetical protein
MAAGITDYRWTVAELLWYRVPPKRWVPPKCKAMPTAKPGPFVELSDGSLLTVEGNATLVSTDDGQTWSEPRPIYKGEGPGIPAVGPMLKTRNGVIVLVYMDLVDYKFKWDQATDNLDADLDVWAICSLDEGQTWVDRQKILDGYCGSLQNMIQTKDGHIVVPVQDAVRGPVHHAQYVFVSADDGKTWTRSNLIDIGGHGDHDGGFEATVVELNDGRLWQLIRTNLDRFWSAYSDDHGYHWRVVEPSSIDASSSPGYFLRLASGRLVLAWNRLYPEGLDDAAKAVYPRRPPGRTHETATSWQRDELSIAFSNDDGKTWTTPVVIARKKGGNLSYPYIFEHKSGELWIRANAARVSLQEADFVRG